jgi:hypothetical protein
MQHPPRTARASLAWWRLVAVMREGRQPDRAAARRAGPVGAGGSSADIELAVRIRPVVGPAPAAVMVADGGAVQVRGQSFHYQSSVVCGSDQTVAFVSGTCRICRSLCLAGG